MKVVLLWIIRAAVVSGCAALLAQLWFTDRRDLPEKDDTALRVASFNAHYIWLGGRTGPWTVAGWDARKHAFDQAFKALDADIVGFQEMESFARNGDGNTNLARDWIMARNPDYAVASTGDASVFPPTQPLFYRKDRLRLLDQGWFFFSDTPDVLYARTFNGSYPAFLSWARFEDRHGVSFTVANFHTDAFSRSNRRKSADLMKQRLTPVAAQGPLILMGDLNALTGSYVYRTLTEIGVEFPRVPGATYHLNKGLHLFGAIDRIGATKEMGFVSGPYVLQKRFEGVWPSDHYPVVADIVLPQSIANNESSQ